MIKKLKIIILSVVIILSISIIITALLIGFTPLKIAQLEGISMTGIDRDYWFHFAWESDDLNLDRNDIVIFNPLKAGISKKLSKYKKLEDLNGETFTKRILALEGESVEIKNGKLYINDKIAKKDFSIDEFAGDTMEKIKIPKDHYFVAGDYRSNSLDSRYFGPIFKSSITAEVIVYNTPILKKISDLVKKKYQIIMLYYLK
jgi:signal peptidase I